MISVSLMLHGGLDDDFMRAMTALALWWLEMDRVDVLHWGIGNKNRLGRFYSDANALIKIICNTILLLCS